MTKNKKIIARVYINQSNGQKLITIPKESKINDGDFVEIKKVIIK